MPEAESGHAAPRGHRRRNRLFAHPGELELALVFDANGIVWEYEPHTFVLERHPDGSIKEAFTPDFHLPEIGMYVECTVMRQRWTSRKRRKVTKARERLDLSVEILFRHDFQRLADRWRLRALGRAANSRSEV